MCSKEVLRVCIYIDLLFVDSLKLSIFTFEYHSVTEVSVITAKNIRSQLLMTCRIMPDFSFDRFKHFGHPIGKYMVENED